MSSSIAPLVLVTGDEELLISRALEHICRAVLAADPDADVREYQAGSVEAAAIHEALSPSLFGGMRVVVLRDAHEAKAPLVAALAPYLDQPADDVVIVVQHLGGARGKALAEAMKKAGAEVVNCAKLTKPGERVEFVRAEVRRAGGSIVAAAAQALVDAVGTDLRELAAVATQLAQDSRGKVSADVVARHRQGRAEVKGFEVSDRALAGDVPGALESLRWALLDGVPAVVLADALAQGVSSVARVAAAGRGNPYELAQRLGMPPWKIQRVQGQTRGWSAAALASALAVVAQLNADVKGAAVDAEYALERAVRAVAGSPQR